MLTRRLLMCTGWAALMVKTGEVAHTMCDQHGDFDIERVALGTCLTTGRVDGYDDVSEDIPCTGHRLALLRCERKDIGGGVCVTPRAVQRAHLEVMNEGDAHLAGA